ncbi:unnamed protein product, partial [Ectocarpus sp. 6 AP-2014]
MVLNWRPRIVRLQNPVRIRADGATSGNVRWLSRPFRPGSEPQLADDPSCGDLRTAGVSQNPEARRRRDRGLAVHPPRGGTCAATRAAKRDFRRGKHRGYRCRHRPPPPLFQASGYSVAKNLYYIFTGISSFLSH